jgi:hypothetical protein
MQQGEERRLVACRKENSTVDKQHLQHNTTQVFIILNLTTHYCRIHFLFSSPSSSFHLLILKLIIRKLNFIATVGGE